MVGLSFLAEQATIWERRAWERKAEDDGGIRANDHSLQLCFREAFTSPVEEEPWPAINKCVGVASASPQKLNASRCEGVALASPQVFGRASLACFRFERYVGVVIDSWGCCLLLLLVKVEYADGHD
jgi:hypothetical protein